jgi:hypothetical protein
VTCVADRGFCRKFVPDDTFAQFWHQYLRQHADRRTRIAHYAGTGLAIGAVTLFAITANWTWLVAAPLVAYAFAWAGHRLIEHNIPLTFTNPFWSLACDFRMFFLAITGRLPAHLQAAQRTASDG